MKNINGISTRGILAVLVFGIASQTFAQDQRALAKVRVVATGGTIAGEQQEPGTLGGYQIKKSVNEVVSLIPNVQRYADVETEQFSNVGSPSITPQHWLGLAQRINTLFKERPDLSGVVVTHGTSRLEETAFFLYLTIRSDRPVVVVGRNLTAATGAREIDAKGMLLLPGGIDPHVHLTPTPTAATLKGADDYTSGSRAALAGGKTTISNFINQAANTDLRTTLAQATELVRKQAIADVILHVTASDPNQWSSADVAMLADRGFTLKIFLVRPSFDQNAAGYLTLIRAAGAAGVLTMLHCEDASIVTTTQERMMAEGRGALKGQNFAESRPVVAEEIATQRAVAISETTGAPIYIVHISSERAMRAAEVGQARGLPIFTEVRFLYLHLTKERFDEPDGAIYTGDPPLREKSDADYLWSAIARGAGYVVDTDHVGYTREDKLDPSLNIVNHRPAGNYLQVDLPLLYSEGVRKGRITLERMVALTSTNPAKLFGLYPRKGMIAVGSDADVVIWDPNLKRTIRNEDQLANAKFSIFAGWEVTGWPVVTIRRGEVVYQGGKILAAAGSGQLAPRQHWQRP